MDRHRRSGVQVARRVWPVVALLLLFVVRTHAVTRQEAFIDEGYHAARARVVWRFDDHPARAANGKLLLYFWLGLFDLQAGTALYSTRTAVALCAPVSGACVYAVGQRFGGRAAGLLALALYAILPLAVFFERMALADPLASAFACLLAWYSLVFARRPTPGRGVVIGILIALVTLAKLTMGLIPLLPVAAAVIMFPWRVDGWRSGVRRWRRAYLRPLMLAAGVVVLVWLPILVPALLARDTDSPFILVNPPNLQRADSARSITQLADILPQVCYYTSVALVLAAGLAAICLVSCSWRGQMRRGAVFVLVWLVLIVALPAVAAKDMRSRYLMPTAAPLALLLALGAAQAWRVVPGRAAVLVRSALVTGGAAWVVLFALPFDITALTDPPGLSLSARDMGYVTGSLAGDALREAAAMLEQVDPPADAVYAVRGTCNLLFFYSPLDVHCLKSSTQPDELAAHRLSYVVYDGSGPPQTIQGLRWELVAEYPRQHTDRVAQVWRVQLAGAE
ncbi:MAG: glycosyltransferase family 39 protein [Anaerolineae bacterium]|nr:glycosyltransferase family 39 protein [Anaerolineae bacterium]